MSRSESSPRWQRRADARPDELLAAALHVFAERGYAATRLDEVARRAGVTKGTLYLYFANKEELFKAVVRQALVSRLDQAAITMQHSQVSHWAQLAHFLTEITRRVLMSELSAIPKLVIAEAGNFPDLARFYFEEVIQQGRGLIQGFLQRGMACGEFRTVDSDYVWRVVLAPMLLGILWKHTFQAFEPDGLDFERHLRVHLDLLQHGLLATPALAPCVQTAL